MSRSTAKRDLQAFEEAGSPGAIVVEDRVNPGAAVLRVIRSHIAALDAAELAMESSENQSAKVGAIKAVASTGVSLLAVLSRVGLLGDQGLLEVQRELQFASRVIAELAESHGVPLDAAHEAAERVLIGPPPVHGSVQVRAA